MKAWNRGTLNGVKSLISQDSENEDYQRSPKNSPRSARSKSALGSPAKSARSKSARGPARESRDEFNARRRREEIAVRHQKHLELRDSDVRSIQERCERNAQEREQRFEQRLESLRRNDVLRVQAADIITKHEAAERSRRDSIYNEWDVQVCQRIEHSLQRFMHPQSDEQDPQQTLLKGGMDLHRKHDPVKRVLYQQKQEEEFRRTADAIIDNTQLRRSANLAEQIRQREADEEAVRNRLTSRPVLPIPLWEQRQHYSTPYGYFAQGCEKAQYGSGFHSARRQSQANQPDAHRPDELDGVPAAGKTKTRHESQPRAWAGKNSLGLLTGEHAKRGESIKYKQAHGASCGAPNQDHYFYPSGHAGNVAADLEFPVGKRVFPHMLA